jgi:lycopene cyclase domain-containing protein
VTYSALTGCALTLAICWDLILLRTRLLARKGFWVSYAIMLGFQLVINGVLTGVRVVRYDRHAILGPRLAYAPIEDIGFGFSLILITLSCWVFRPSAQR